LTYSYLETNQELSMSTASSLIQTHSAAGCVAFWKARRVLRQRVVDAVAVAGCGTVPAIDPYDALVEAGMAVVRSAQLGKRRAPVRADSLSRTGVGCEFYQTTKGDKENDREFLFSIGVDPTNKAFLIKVGVHPLMLAFFASAGAEDALDALYRQHLQYMAPGDVTDALTSVVNANRAIRLKDGGGVYFIPECGIGPVGAAFTALNAAGCRCSLWQHDLSDPESCKQVLEATNEQLVAGLEEMQNEMQDLIDNDKKPRINGLRSKMQELAKYADLLGYYQKMFGDNMTQASVNLQTTFELLAELQLRHKSSK